MAATASTLDDVILPYPINPQSRGVVIIINMYEFEDSSYNRVGGEQDSERLKQLFFKFGYKEEDVRLFENKTSDEIEKILEEVKTQLVKPEHSTFAMCIMSHGEKNNRFLCYDMTSLHLWKFVLTRFCDKTCRALAGTPKLVITQFCRGDKQVEEVKFDDLNVKEISIPEWRDLILLQASPPYHAALRGESGSVFIQKFCDVCERYYTSETVDSIMHRVITIVSQEKFQVGNDIVQVLPGIGWNSLCKKLYLSEEASKNYEKSIKEVKVSSHVNKEGGLTPLYIASLNGNAATVKDLVQNGAPVNQGNKDGVTPLYVASEKGHTDVVNILIGHGADVNQGKNNGVTPLYIACQRGHRDVVTTLIQNRAQVNQGNDNGVTPLYIASQNGHADVVQILLEHGAQVTQGSKDGFTPLYIASRYGHAHVVNVLLEHKADINQGNKDGVTPLYVASQTGHADIVNILIQHGAQVNIKTKNGATPRHVASQKGHADVIKILTQNGAQE